MGACATKFKVLEDAPAPAEEVAASEGEVKKDGAAAAVEDEAKRQSLGHLFNENEVVTEKDATEQVKQENAAATDNQKSEVSEDKKTEDVKPPTQSAETDKSQNKNEEKVEEKRVVESPKEATDAVNPKA